MKRNHTSTWMTAGACALAAVCTTISVPAADVAAVEPGFVDFGEVASFRDAAKFVEVNLPLNLLSLAARLTAKDEPDISALLSGLKSVRVNVIGLTDANRGDLTRRMEKVRADLSGRGWQQVVTARERGEEVNVMMKTGAGDMIEGVTVTVLGRKDEAVFINVVGNIKPEQLAVLGERFGIDPLKNVGQRTGG